MTPIAMTIAGSDPSGGAGVQADLKTFQQHNVFGTSVLTLITVQNTLRVSRVELLDRELIVEQLRAVTEDLKPAAAKTGALGSAEIIAAVAEQVRDFDFPLVVDPVMISKHGDSLLDDGAIATMQAELLPQAFLLTPNVHEATKLSGVAITDVDSQERAARELASRGPENVLVKGGAGSGDAVDVLVMPTGCYKFSSPRTETDQTHGSGCVLSAAITARLARGEALLPAVSGAKAFISDAISSAPHLGRGRGPVNLNTPVK